MPDLGYFVCHLPVLLLAGHVDGHDEPGPIGRNNCQLLPCLLLNPSCDLLGLCHPVPRPLHLDIAVLLEDGGRDLRLRDVQVQYLD